MNQSINQSINWSVLVWLVWWRYARKEILVVRICVMTELITRCEQLCKISVPFPGKDPSRKSSLSCSGFSHDSRTRGKRIQNLMRSASNKRMKRYSGSIWQQEAGPPCALVGCWCGGLRKLQAKSTGCRRPEGVLSGKRRVTWLNLVS